MVTSIECLFVVVSLVLCSVEVLIPKKENFKFNRSARNSYYPAILDQMEHSQKAMSQESC